MPSLSEVSAPYWDDKPLAIVAGGPSLKHFDFDQLRPFHVLAVKGSMFDLPWADAGFGIDMPRLVEWINDKKFDGVKMPIYWAMPDKWQGSRQTIKMPDNVIPLLRETAVRMSDDPTMVYSGGSSGFSALNVALLKRAKHVALFGYDYTIMRGSHHNEQHYRDKRNVGENSWRDWAANFKPVAKTLAGRMDIVNGSKHSKITAFPTMSPNEAVIWLHERG